MTKIEWTDQTWNPVTGCTKISPGCANCYAERMAKRLAGRFGYPLIDPFRVTLHPKRLDEPKRWRKPRMVFVCSMGDLFHDEVPHWFIEHTLKVIAENRRHVFQILTKRPGRSLAFQFTNNIWFGISVEDAQHLQPRLTALPSIPGVRFLSLEPLLGPINSLPLDGIDWVIVGSETGPRARPMNPDWARSIRDQCRSAGVPFFLKQMAKREPIPDDLRIREWPLCDRVIDKKLVGISLRAMRNAS